MKLKIALIAATLSLTGCAGLAPYGEVVDSSDVGQVRVAHEQRVYEGDLKWRNGSGLTYTRKPNQCGKNCAKYAEADRQVAEARADMSGMEADMKRVREKEERALRGQQAQNWCVNYFVLFRASYADKFNRALRATGVDSKETRAAAKTLDALDDNSLKLINECTEEKLNELSN